MSKNEFERSQPEMFVPIHMTQQLVIDENQLELKELELAKELTSNQKVQDIIEDFLNQMNLAAKGQYLNENFFNYEKNIMFNQLFEAYNPENLPDTNQRETIFNRGLYNILQDPNWANKIQETVSTKNKQFYNEFTHWLHIGEHLNQTIKE